MKLRPYAEIADQWDALVDRCPAAWFWHRKAWIEYCLEYRPGSENWSAGLEDESGALVALIPLIVDGDQIQMGTEPNVAPVWWGRGVTDAVVTIRAVMQAMHERAMRADKGVTQETTDAP